MQRLQLFVSTLGYTDLLMIGGIAAIAIYLWNSNRSKPSTTMVDLKKLKVLPNKYMMIEMIDLNFFIS
jgi:hypothetical protein